MTEEIIASVMATVVAVVGIMKGLAYLTEKRNERNGTERYTTCSQCKDYRSDCAAARGVLKTDMALDRAEVKADNKAWRSSADDEMVRVNIRIGEMERGLKLEILELGKKIDKFLELIPKKQGR